MWCGNHKNRFLVTLITPFSFWHKVCNTESSVCLLRWFIAQLIVFEL